MNAYRLFHDGMRFEDVARPEPRGEQVLVRVAGAGLCHSDLHVEALAAGGKVPWPLPFTLGHEIAGWVEALGPEAAGVAPGDPVAVYSAWGCGTCAACRAGSDNYCANERALHGPGLGVDGGMASHVLVPSARYLAPLGDLDPRDAAPLADAGITPYHAVARGAHAYGPQAAALVIGVGGLGHLAIQILRAVGEGTRIVAVDLAPDKLALAREMGADAAVPGGEGALERVREAAGGRFADVVLDFVGAQSTVDLARKIVRPDGDVVLVGLAGGALPIRQGSVPYGARFSISFYGSIADLHATVALARAGKIRPRVTRYPLDRADEAFDALRQGALAGRAVVCPNG